MSTWLDREQADAMVERLRAVAQPQRLIILTALLDGELPVGEIEAATSIGQPALSQQLAELRRTGVVATRREVRQIFYRISDEASKRRILALFEAFGEIAPAVRIRRPSTPERRPVVAGAASFARVG